MLQRKIMHGATKILCAAAETLCSQINASFKKKSCPVSEFSKLEKDRARPSGPSLEISSSMTAACRALGKNWGGQQVTVYTEGLI